MNIVSDGLVIFFSLGGLIILFAICEIAHHFAYKYIPAFATLWDRLCGNLSNGL